MKIIDVVAVAILQSRNFKVVYVKLFVVKRNSIFFGGGYYNRKSGIFPFTFYLRNYFTKNPEEKKPLNNLAKFLFITCRLKTAQSQKNNVRAKAGWLICYFADIE